MDNKRIVNIMGKDVERIEYKGQPVITFRMVDELHERPISTARQSFNRNKDKLIEEEDFFEVPYGEWSEIPAVCETYGSSNQRNSIVFLTESGYLMIVKPFGDDRAWQVQRDLVKSYFVAKETLHTTPADEQNSQSLLKDAMRLLDIVCNELEYVREERNDLRQKLLAVHDSLIAKGAAPSKARPMKSRSATNEEDEILNDFIITWWNEYGDDNVGVSHLYPMIKKYEIPLELGGGTERTRRIRLGRKLTAICSRQFGDYIITTGKPFRNLKRYKLQLVPPSLIPED